MHSQPLVTAVAGIGGFGGAHHDSLLHLEKNGVFRVVATCDPALPSLGEAVERFGFAGRGVALYRGFDEMLAAHGDGLEVMTVAAPIRFHAPMHRACRERNIACYLEKPPTLDPAELEAMIALDESAPVPTQVGFNYIYQPFRRELKARIARGEFGRLLRVAYTGLWQRAVSYYGRNTWAGRLLLEDDYVLLDSCCGNAMSHHLHNILFFAGDGEGYSWARPVTVEAELYRANAIEGTDTVFARGVLENGVEFRLAASHACDERGVSRETLTCEEAEIVIDPVGLCRILRRDGTIEEFQAGRAVLRDNLELYADVVRGRRSRPETRLDDCRAFVELNALLYLAAGRIETVPASRQVILKVNDGVDVHAIPEVAEVCERAVATGEFPSEQGVAWGGRGGSASREALPQLKPTLRALAAESGARR